MFVRFLFTLVLLPLISAAAAVEPGVFDPRNFGAKPDGLALCTGPIQQAIEACAAAGGGTVRLSGGQFLSGTLQLRSHVTLEITAGSTLLGSSNLADYPVFDGELVWLRRGLVRHGLIVGENLKNVGLVGRGVIDGQGAAFKLDRARPNENRPYLIRLTNCRDVLVEGLRLQNSGMWMQHYLGCTGVTVRGLRVSNFSNYNNDGIDLDGCKDCTVSQCIFESDDDGITLKSTFERPCENITISDCIVRSHCNAIKLGTESNGGFRNITITNCVVTSPEPRKVLAGRARGTSGISLELVDGGVLERIAISNIVIHGVEVPLFLRLGDRGRPFKKDQAPIAVGSFRDVTISNIVATGAGKVGCSITGLPDAPIESVALSNIMVQFEGGGARELADKKVEEHPKKYPEATMFGELPSYGFYIRHARGVRVTNLQLRTATPDARHALVFDDATDITLGGLDVTATPGSAASVYFHQVRNALVGGWRSSSETKNFLKISGNQSSDIDLTQLRFQSSNSAVEITADVPVGGVQFR